MIRHIVLLVLSALSLSQVDSAKQQVQLSDSYLPVSMQIIAHLTDQMAFEVKDDVTSKPTAKPSKPTSRPPKPTTKPTTVQTRPTTKPTTSRPPEITTPHHKPGLYAPYKPPKQADRFSWNQHKFVLLPVENHAQYTILEPQEKTTEEPLLSIHHEEIKPLMESNNPNQESAPYLPPHSNVKISSRSDSYLDDVSEENLQYLSDDVREMIKMANNPNDDKVVDIWDGVRHGNQPASTKAKLSASNLRLLLLYDLLSRDAKRQRLSDYSGFSPDVMKVLVESSSGGARAQLKMALSKMVERHDCGHEYANNRAKEMVAELAKDESGMSTDLRYLQPLVYSF